MKRILLIIVLIGACLLATVGIQAQNVVGDISNGLKTANISSFSKHFAANLTLSILGNENNYTSQSAGNAVKSFLQTNKPKSFAVKHRGNAPNNAKFIVGTLNTNNGNFRTYIVIRNSKIQKISFKK